MNPNAKYESPRECAERQANEVDALCHSGLARLKVLMATKHIVEFLQPFKEHEIDLVLKHAKECYDNSHEFARRGGASQS